MNPFIMTPGVAAAFLSALCGFILKITAAYFLCWLLARIATSAAARFVVWLAYLMITGAYWIYCILHFYRSSLITTGVPARGLGSPSGITWTIPSSIAQIIGTLLGPICLFYAAVLVVMALLGVWKRIQLARALSYRTAPSEELTRTFETIESELHLSNCDLWLLPGLTSPAALGWLKPAVYLPLECGDEEQAGLHNVLRHELSHIKRKDGLWESISRFSRFLVFFHPFVHKAFASLRCERELACDMVIIRKEPEKRYLYADTLVRFGWKTAVAEQRDYGIGFISQSAVLNARVKSILNGERVYSRWSRRGRALLTTGVLWVFAAAAPALWIGFTLTTVPRSITATSDANLHPTVKIHRHFRSSLSSKIKPQLALSARFNGAPLTEPSTSTSHAVHYHIQNADEPMSNPVSEETESGVETDGEPGRSITPKRQGLPSATSVLTDTATQLSEMGIGRGHDHDRD